MATGHNPLGINAYLNTRPPAMIRAAKDIAYYESRLKQNAEERSALMLEYKESGVWKEKYLTWQEACDAMDISKSQANRIVAQAKSKDSIVTHGTPTQPPLSEESNNKPEQSHDSSLNGKPGPDSEVPTKRTESGKPKQGLSIWRELLEKVCGLGLNRTNDLNHICPNPERHKRLRATFQSAWEQVEEWRRDTK